MKQISKTSDPNATDEPAAPNHRDGRMRSEIEAAASNEVNKSENETTTPADDQKADGRKADGQKASIPRKTSWLRRILLLVFLGTVALALVVAYCVYEAQRMPDFYAEVIENEAAQPAVEGDKFERNLALMNNAFRRTHPWKIKFTQDEINGWLASDLNEKFGDVVPKEISDPRIVFTEHEIRIAFKYEKKGMSGIVVATCDIFCTENENELAIKLLGVRSGVVSLPIGPWLDRITEGFQFAGVDLIWSEEDDKPVALIKMPDRLQSNGLHQYVILEAIDVRPGQLVIAGSSARKQTKPRGK